MTAAALIMRHSVASAGATDACWEDAFRSRGQSNCIEGLTRWAAQQPQFQGACVFALGDYEEKMGLVNSQGRKRPAYDNYQQLAAALRGQRKRLEPSGMH